MRKAPYSSIDTVSAAKRLELGCHGVIIGGIVCRDSKNLSVMISQYYRVLTAIAYLLLNPKLFKTSRELFS